MSAVAEKGKGKVQARDEASPDTPLPHPAEDLSSDDDILSWILVDQLGGMPNSKLGVHPQENKFVGPRFKTEEVLDITIVKGNLPAACAQMQEFHLIAAHAKAKRTESQRERFIQHLRRYLLPYAPNSRVDIHTTNRYSHITLHPELAVYATRPLAPGTVLQELQGSVVELPEEWRKEMDLSDDFIEARLAAGEESEDDLSDDDDESAVARSSGANGEAGPSNPSSRAGKGKGKEREADRGARRSGRTRRRDFSIVWSELKRCYQLFLGPARFLNHDCTPNVELLRQGKYVTFRVTRPVRIGDELTTTYGADYFGPNNIECLCLSCELAQRGPYAVKPSSSSTSTRGRSEQSRSATPSTPVKSKIFKPSKLRESILAQSGSVDSTESPTPVEGQASESIAESSTMGSKAADGENDVPLAVASDVDELESDSGSDTPEPVKRERLSRAAKLNKPFNFHRRQHSVSKGSSGGPASPFGGNAAHNPDDDLPEDFPRCATCAVALHERMWWGGRYFDHCPRCTRHAFIFSLPWPAHKSNEVQEYPPSHLIPPNYVPVRISTVPLPSLTKKRIMPVATADPSLAEDGMLPVTKEYRAQLRLRKEIALEEFQVEALREEAWAVHLAYEEALDMARTQQEARLEEKRLAREAKKVRDAEKVKGSGLWSRYVYITEEEVQRREQERHALTLGTRRGGRYKREDMEGTPEREMREVRDAMRKEWDEEEKAVSKMRMESWKAEQGVEAEVHSTPKKKKLGKVIITPKVKAIVADPASVSRSFTAPRIVKPHPKGAERRNTKAARTARTAAASAARRKSLPNPTSAVTPFVAAITAAATGPSGKAAAKAKGKGKARAVSEGEQSDADTIEDVNDLIDTGRPSKKQRDMEATHSPVIEASIRKSAKAGPMGTYQSTFRISLPGKRLAPGPAALPESSAAAGGVNGAYKSKRMHPGQAVLRLGPTASGEVKAGSAGKGKGKAREQAYEDGTSSSEGMRRSVSAALEAIDRSRTETPMDGRHVDGYTPETGVGGRNTGIGKRGSSSSKGARAKTSRAGATTALASPVAIGNKRKRKSQSAVAQTPSTPLSSLTASPVKTLDNGGSESDNQQQQPPTKRPRGRPRGSGYLQKRAAAQAEKEKKLAERTLDVEKAEAKRQRRNAWVREYRAKRKAELKASLARSASSTAAGNEDESFTATTAATLVSETAPGNVSEEGEEDYMSDNSAVLVPIRRNITKYTLVASGVKGDTEANIGRASESSRGKGKEKQAGAGRTGGDASKAAASSVWIFPSRTPSPFLRRSSRDDGHQGSAAPNPPKIGGREVQQDVEDGYDDQGGNQHGAAYGDDDDIEGVEGDDYGYNQPPSPLLAPRPSYTAPIIGRPLRMEHYAPDAPEANSKGWIVEPGSRELEEQEDATGGRRRSNRRANINYTSHRQLIRDTLGSAALKPDHRTPASQLIRGDPGEASGSASASLPADGIPRTQAAYAQLGYPLHRPHRAYIPKTIVPYSFSH